MTVAAAVRAWRGPTLACPRCAGPIRLDASSVSCPACAQSWPVADGVPTFVRPDHYWGEVPRDEMHLLLDLARTHGWREGLERFFDARPTARHARVIEKLRDPSVANWSGFLGLPADAVVLDVGAGMGTMAAAFARRFRTVVALEQVEERVAFIHLRTAQDGLAERVSVVRADALAPPFPAATFDLVALNGVLEWLPMYTRDADPEEAQRRMLRQARRILKPGGFLYVGIEARYALRILRGFSGPHGEGPFVACLPRGIAGALHKRTTKEPYRTYIHSPRALARMFEQEGFTEVQVVEAVSSYNVQQHLVPLPAASAQRFRGEKLRVIPRVSRAWELARAAVLKSGAQERLLEQMLVIGRKP
jgi:ubiquinone/menaquinone biosynthesis C-methylase UbiE